MGTDKPTTRVLLVVDRSGSMARHAPVVRSGLAEYVQMLRDDKDVRYRVTVATFADDWELVCRGVKPKEVPPFDEVNYHPRGMTALHYAVGMTIDDHEMHREVGHADDKTILVVQTDGGENASHHHTQPIVMGKGVKHSDAPPLYDGEKIKAMIAEREARGWTCVYLGAGPAAWSGGHEFGTRVETHSTASAHANTYSGLGSFTRKVSRDNSGTAVAVAASELRAEANKDDE